MGVSGGTATLTYVLIVAIWLAALTFSIWVNRQEKGSEETQPA